MVKLVERVRQIINVRTDLMGRSFLTGTVHHCIEAAQLTHQIFFGSALCLLQTQVFQALSLLLILGKDRFNTHDCIQNIRTRVSLEGSEAINIENIVLRSLIGQISVFDCGKTDDFGDLSCLFLRQIMTAFGYLTVHFLVDIADQVFQTHNAALSRLEGLSVLAVHRAETNIF